MFFRINKISAYRAAWLLSVLALTLTACWVDFPDERLDGVNDASHSNNDFRTTGADMAVQDASSSSDVIVTPSDAALPDLQIEDSGNTDAIDPQVDAQVDAGVDATPDASPSDTFTFTCEPNDPIECSGLLTLRVCNENGNGIRTITCPLGCNSDEARCNECTSAALSWCSLDETTLSECVDGVWEETTCETKCENALCCEDGDEDGYLNCEDDCDDSDPQVHPDLPTDLFFTEPRDNGSFDYNCDGQEELQIEDVALCTRVFGEGCVLVGNWYSVVPSCGEGGALATGCSEVGVARKCAVDNSTDSLKLATQACR